MNKMKKIIPILMLCIGFASTVKAEDIDLSTYDNVIYVASTSVEAGSNATLSICMKNTVPIRGFQFRLYLPEGVSVVKNSKGKIQVSLAASRLEEDDDHTISASEQSDGSILILCGSEYPENIIGNDGEVATLSISVTNGMASGNYPLFIKKIKLSETDISKYYETEQVETTITITVAKDNHIVLDETTTTMPKEATNVNVRLNRSINANRWNTIVLPFSATGEQIKANYGDDVELALFTSWSTEEYDGAIVGINVGFTSQDPANGIEANTPMLIKVSKNVDTAIFDGVTLKPEEEPVVQVKNTTKNGYFYGTYVKKTVPEKNIFLSDGKFWYSTGKTTTKAYRGYFAFQDVLDAYYDHDTSVKFNLILDDVETGIENLSEVPSQNNAIYNLAGQRIHQTQRGVNIINGKKVMIK